MSIEKKRVRFKMKKPEREYIIINKNTLKTTTVFANNLLKAIDKAHEILKSNSKNNYTEVK